MTVKRMVLSLTLMACSCCAAAESCTHDVAAAPVLAYVEAMKEYRFADAYDVLTETMTDGTPKDTWIEGQRKMFDLGQVVIGKIDVRWPQHIDEASCDERATVPNVLSAKDRFNNQGSVEFEIYTVVNQGGVWRIESQETLIDDAEIHKWFPGDEIPEFKDQLSVDEPMPGDD